jgi:hypothetical protein
MARLIEHYFKTKIYFTDCLLFKPYGTVHNKHFCSLKQKVFVNRFEWHQKSQHLFKGALYHKWKRKNCAVPLRKCVNYGQKKFYNIGPWRCRSAWWCRSRREHPEVSCRSGPPFSPLNSVVHCINTWLQGILKRKNYCTIDLLIDWFEFICMTTDNFCFYLQNTLIQTSQTGGQWYSDTSPISILSWLASRTSKKDRLSTGLYRLLRLQEIVVPVVTANLIMPHAVLGSVKTKGREPKSCLGWVFNFKCGRVLLYLAFVLITKTV